MPDNSSSSTAATSAHTYPPSSATTSTPAEPSQDVAPSRSVARSMVSFLMAQWSLLLMAILILLAYYFPHIGMTGGTLRAEYTVSWACVGLIFLVAGLSLAPDQLLKGLPHWKAHFVANTFSLLFVPALMFGFATAGRTANLDFYIMAGMVITGCLPTGISNNVTCTINAGGSGELASIEVVPGAIIGTFLTPLIVEMFLTPRVGWEAAAPGSHAGVTEIYIRMAKQLSATLFAPLILGLAIQVVFPKATAWTRKNMHLGKQATIFTMLCVWHNFCNAFTSGAFTTASHATIIYLCFINISLYLLLTALIFAIVRLPSLTTSAAAWWRMSKKDTIALCFCGPGKGVALGAPLLAILYANVSLNHQAKMALALLIYNGEQIACTQLMVPLLRHWARDEIHKKNDDAALPRRSAVDSGVVEAGLTTVVEVPVGRGPTEAKNGGGFENWNVHSDAGSTR